VQNLRAPNNRASCTEQGFDESDWDAPGSDRLVDAMVAHGTASELTRRLAELRDAGADHVAVIPLGGGGSTEEPSALDALAPRDR
jgi:hypothetical protein